MVPAIKPLEAMLLQWIADRDGKYIWSLMCVCGLHLAWVILAASLAAELLFDILAQSDATCHRTFKGHAFAKDVRQGW